MSYDRSKTVGRVAFLAHRGAIRDLLEKGHRNKAVFTDLEAKLAISYSQFNRYVLRYITGEKDNGHQRESTVQSAPSKVSPAPTAPTAERIRDNSPQIPKLSKKSAKFWHDPNSGNNHDDLI